MISTDVSSHSIAVDLSTERDRPAISNLLQLMLYDVSRYYGEWISRDGRYAYEWLDNFWTEQDRYPYIISRQNLLAGFALAMAHSPISGRAPCWFMGEFFILKAQRRCGYGQAAFRQILLKHSGNWEIAVNTRNRDAISFWANSLSNLGLQDLAKETRTHDKSEWAIHYFSSF